MARPKTRTKTKVRGERQPETLPSGRYRGWTWNAVAQKKGPSKTFDSFAEADAWMRREQDKIDGHYTEAGVPVKRNRHRWSVPDYAMRWAKSVTGIEGTTRTRLLSQARQIGKYWKHLMVDEYDRVAVTEYMAFLEERGLSPATRRMRLEVISHISVQAVQDGLRGDDPTIGVNRPPHTTLRSHRILSDEEFERVLRAAPVWLRPALLLARDSGLRVSEVCGVRWHRIDLKRKTIEVGDVILQTGEERTYPKGKKVLTVPLTTRTVAALDKHSEEYPGGPMDHVFIEPGRNLLRVMPQRMARLLRKAVVKAGIAKPWPVFHDLRHACAYALRQAGAPLDVVQAILRHASIVTSKIYIPDAELAEARLWLDRSQESPVESAPLDPLAELERLQERIRELERELRVSRGASDAAREASIQADDHRDAA